MTRNYKDRSLSWVTMVYNEMSLMIMNYNQRASTDTPRRKTTAELHQSLCRFSQSASLYIFNTPTLPLTISPVLLGPYNAHVQTKKSWIYVYPSLVPHRRDSQETV